MTFSMIWRYDFFSIFSEEVINIFSHNLE